MAERQPPTFMGKTDAFAATVQLHRVLVRVGPRRWLREGLGCGREFVAVGFYCQRNEAYNY